MSRKRPKTTMVAADMPFHFHAGACDQAVLSFRILFHRSQTRVVVGDLPEMRKRDHPRDDLVIVRYVGDRVLAAVLELDGESHPELLKVYVASRPIDADPLPDRPEPLPA